MKLELHERHIKTIEFMFPLFKESVDYNASSAPIFGMGTRRICSPFHTENYFRLVPKAIEFTKSELDEIMYTMPKERVLDTLYMHYCKGTLDRLMTEIRTQITDPERMMMFTKIVCFVKDHTNDDLLNSNLEQYQQYNFYILDTAGTIGCTLLQLYSELLNGQDMSTLPLFLRTIEHHFMLWESIPHLDKKDVTELRAMICEYIRKNCDDFDALNSPTFVILIIVLITIDTSLAEEILNKYVKNIDDLRTIHEKNRAKMYWDQFIQLVPEDLRDEYMEQMQN